MTRFKLQYDKALKKRLAKQPSEWHPRLGKTSPSVALSQPSLKSGRTGQKPTKASDPLEKHICHVLIEAWQRGFTVKCDFARDNAEYVAIAACMGWITTRIFPPDVWGSAWQITSKGLLALEELYGIDTNEEDEEDA